MDQIAQEILDFIRKGGTEVVSFITTVNSKGAPITRQVSTFVEDGWIVGTVSPPRALKALHVARNPEVTYTWVDLTPRRPARAVQLNGRAVILSDPADVAAFLERRAAVYGPLRGAGAPGQVILQTTPYLVRADGFSGGPAPVLIRDFANPVAEVLKLGE